MQAITAPYQCAVVTDLAEFAALGSEWNALHAASHGAYVSDGFEWARLCWQFIGDQPRRGLFCAVLRRHSQLVAVWPLTVSRTRIWRLASALTSQATEYCPFLVHPTADLDGVWTAIRHELKRRGDVDALFLPYVREDSPLGRCLSEAEGSRQLYSLPVRFLHRAEFPDWESYLARLPHGLRVNQGQGWRRLDRLGQVEFQDVSDPAERQAVWEWMVAKKREWLVRRGLRSLSISSDSYARFVASSLDVFAEAGGRRIFALKLNGAVIAAELVNVDRARAEVFVMTFDEAFARYAPGNLLREKVVAWAFERGLDCDWRLGDEFYKQQWANHVAQATSYVLALTPRGKVFVRYALFRQRVADRTPGTLRARVAAILRGGQSLAGLGAISVTG